MGSLLTIPVSPTYDLPPQVPAMVPLPPSPVVPSYLDRSLERARFDACQRFQAYYDEHLCRHVGMRASAPLPDQYPDDYRIESLRGFKRIFIPQNHDLAKLNFRRMRANILSDDSLSPKEKSYQLNLWLNNFEPQIIKACIENKYNPECLEDGEIRMVPEFDAFGRLISNRAVGKTSFVKDMGRPARLVASHPVVRDNTGQPAPYLQRQYVRLPLVKSV